MNMLRLAGRMFWRDLRAGELTLLIVAITLAVASLTSVSLLTDRAERGLNREAHGLLGGDLLLVADHPWPQKFVQEAQNRRLRVTESIVFTSMASTADQAQLAVIKAVAKDYPLRGSIRTALSPHALGQEAHAIPTAGTVWLEPRIADGLQLKIGDYLNVGRAHLRFTAYLSFESDRGTNFLSFLPRIILNSDDLAATGLIQPGSRVTYRLHIAAASNQTQADVDEYEVWAQPQLQRGEHIESLENASPQVRANIERVSRFLRLSAMMAVVFAAVAIGLSIRRFLNRHFDGCAAMRCMGATRTQLMQIFSLEFLYLSTLSAAGGITFGFLFQTILSELVSKLLSTELPLPSLWPIFQGFGVAWLLTLGFLLPPLWRLASVPPTRVLRPENNGTNRTSNVMQIASNLTGFFTLALLVVWVAQDLRLAAYVIAGFATVVISCIAFAYGLLVALTAATHKWQALPWGWRYGILSLRRRTSNSIWQITAFAIGVSALMLLIFIRGDLLNSWQDHLGANAPNQFVLNIQPDQTDAVKKFLHEHLTTTSSPILSPMVKGRLIAINGRQVDVTQIQNERAQRLLEREFNLSWAQQFPEGNKLIAGKWTDKGFSVEEGLAKTLNLKLGDQLRFSVAGQFHEGRITSLRQLDWDSMRVNFFVITPQEMLQHAPATYITSFYLPHSNTRFVSELTAHFPNLSVIDVEAVIKQIRLLTDQLAQIVEFVSSYTLATGVLVLYAALFASRDERIYELGILRTLGAQRRQVKQTIWSEFLLLGFAAGTLATLGSIFIAYLLSTRLLEISFSNASSMFIFGGVLCVISIAVLGVTSTQGVLKREINASLARG